MKDMTSFYLRDINILATETYFDSQFEIPYTLIFLGKIRVKNTLYILTRIADNSWDKNFLT